MQEKEEETKKIATNFEKLADFQFIDPKVELVGLTCPIININDSPTYQPTINIESFIEDAGRTCYKSFDKKEVGTDEKFCNMLLNSGHTSVFEHASASFRIICSRSVLAEITRHRLASFSVQSQRFVNYAKKGLTFIKPSWISWKEIDEFSSNLFKDYAESERTVSENFIWMLSDVCNNYHILIEKGWKPEQAREILPNATATEIVITANFREWINILNQRSDANPAAYSEIRVIANQIAKILVGVSPTIFKQFKK